MNKRFLYIICIFLCFLVVPGSLTFSCFAQNYTSYNGTSNNLSSTYVDYLKTYISSVDPDENYILFRDGEYSYMFAVGKDLTYDKSSNRLSGSDVEILRLQALSSGSYQSHNDYKVSIIHDNNFVYTYDNHMIFSNCVPGIPDLGNNSNQSSKLPYIAIGISVIVLFFVGFKALNRRGISA